MMTKADFKNMIDKSAKNEKSVRLTTKFVRPTFGRFVELADAQELANKGWFRFVLACREDDFQANQKAELTKMINLDSIIFIQTY